MNQQTAPPLSGLILSHPFFISITPQSPRSRFSKPKLRSGASYPADAEHEVKNDVAAPLPVPGTLMASARSSVRQPPSGSSTQARSDGGRRLSRRLCLGPRCQARTEEWHRRRHCRHLGQNAECEERAAVIMEVLDIEHEEKKGSVPLATIAWAFNAERGERATAGSRHRGPQRRDRIKEGCRPSCRRPRRSPAKTTLKPWMATVAESDYAKPELILGHPCHMLCISILRCRSTMHSITAAGDGIIILPSSRDLPIRVPRWRNIVHSTATAGSGISIPTFCSFYRAGIDEFVTW